jgi:transcriptional regulator with XRE-family HTH domain
MNGRIRDIRKKLGLTQSDFGRKIGIEGGSLSMIERGINSLTEGNIKLICSVYNVNEDWIRTGNGEMFNPELIPGGKELLAVYEKLLPINRKLILVHADYLLESQNDEKTAEPVEEKEKLNPATEPEAVAEKGTGRRTGKYLPV